MKPLEFRNIYSYFYYYNHYANTTTMPYTKIPYLKSLSSRSLRFGLLAISFLHCAICTRSSLFFILLPAGLLYPVSIFKETASPFLQFETELILRTASGFLALRLMIKAECKQRKWKLQGLHWQLLSGEAFLPIRKRLLWQRDFSLLTYSNPSLINFVLQLNEFLF